MAAGRNERDETLVSRAARAARDVLAAARSAERGRYGSLVYRCNVCGAACRTPMARLNREQPTCRACGSTMRWRAIISILSQELFGESLTLPEFPLRKDLVGVGLSDSEAYAGRLAGRLGYTNTFLHREPRLDIAAPPADLYSSLDFLIASEVFEHVPPPVAQAFHGARRLLKDTGVLILTVPYVGGAGVPTREHFPDLHDFVLSSDEDGRARLVNRTRSDEHQIFDDLVFHGGGGLDLEMRVFSEEGLIAALWAAGFSRVKVWRDPDFRHGIHWPEPWSLPVVARP